MNKTIKQYVLTAKRNVFEVTLPAKRIVCPSCDGTGKCDNPAFRNGLSEDDMADDEFAQNYIEGASMT